MFYIRKKHNRGCQQLATFLWPNYHPSVLENAEQPAARFRPNSPVFENMVLFTWKIVAAVRKVK
jgi:hypothetical protein